jgi:hypothetical protein
MLNKASISFTSDSALHVYMKDTLPNFVLLFKDQHNKKEPTEAMFPQQQFIDNFWSLLMEFY